MQVELSSHLRYSTRFGFNVFYQDNKSYLRQNQTQSLSSDNPIYSNSYNIMDLSFNWLHALNYSNTFRAVHKVDLALDFEIGQSTSEWIPIARKEYINSLENNVELTDSEREKYKTLRSGVDFSNYAFTGSFQYGFREKYFFNLDLRKESVGFYRDESLINYSDLFPSVSAGWIFTREKFLLPGVLSYGKLRYGWGRAGISPHINYSFFAKMMRDMDYIYAFNSTHEITHSSLKRQNNEKFYWETIESHNVGLEIGMFKNQFWLIIDYFNSQVEMGRKNPIDKPKNLIQILNQMEGFGIVELPVADIKNEGLDLEINFRHLHKKTSWNVGLNLTHFRNKVIHVEHNYLSNTQPSESFDIISRNQPGEGAGYFYGYKIEGLFTADDCNENGEVINQPYTIEGNEKMYAQPSARAGDYKFFDLNGDNKIDSEDKTNLGNPFPDFTFGLYGNINFYNFDIAIMFQGSYGNEIFNATKMWMYNPYGVSNWIRGIKNSYREPEIDINTGEVIDEGFTNTSLHRYDYENANRNLRVSDFYVEDGSYLHLKNIMLGYTINQEHTNKVSITRLRFYVAAQNLFTWMNYSGMDPEVGGWGIDCGSYPQPRMYILGLNVGF